MSVLLKNPHSVAEAIRYRPKEVIEVVCPQSGGPHWDATIQLARENGIKVRSQPSKKDYPKGKKDPRGEKKHGRDSECVARVQEKTSVSLEALFGAFDEKKPGLWLALDQVQDPQNLGAIFRLASFFGVRGILLTDQNSAPVSGVTYDVASGGVETVPFSIQSSFSSCLEYAKKQDIWVLGTSEHAHDSIHSVQMDRSWLLVLGNEEKGIRRLTEERCDLLCKIASDSSRGVQSLNVSVAAGICVSYLTQFSKR